MKTEKQYKELTIKEFTKAADIYESGSAGIYEMCKEDYPYISGELEKENYTDLLEIKVQSLIQFSDSLAA